MILCHFRKQYKLEIIDLGLYMGILSVMMPFSLFVLVPLFTGKFNMRDRDGWKFGGNLVETIALKLLGMD